TRSDSQIGEIVRAIVEQDTHMYPNGDATKMSTNDGYFHRRYRAENRELSLDLLANWVRFARGVKSRQKNRLGDFTILQEWKKNLFGIAPEVKAKKPAFLLRLDFELSDQPTEKECDEVIRAIVEQDGEFYPKGDASGINTAKKHLERRYRSNDREFTLETLTDWARRARKKTGGGKWVGYAEIHLEWKERLFGIRSERKPLEAFSLKLDFSLPEQPNEREIGEIVKAIVEQDRALYPNGDASEISTGKKFFHKRYEIGGQDFTLATLAGWTRNAR